MHYIEYRSENHDEVHTFPSLPTHERHHYVQNHNDYDSEQATALRSVMAPFLRLYGT